MGSLEVHPPGVAGGADLAADLAGDALLHVALHVVLHYLTNERTELPGWTNGKPSYLLGSGLVPTF